MFEPLEPRRHLSFGDLDLSLRGVGWTQLLDTATPFTGAALDNGAFYTLSGKKLVRYRANGTLDLQFGSRGRAYLGLPTSAVAMQVLPGGKVLVATNEAGLNESTYQRFNPDGTPDVTFGPNGVRAVDRKPGNLLLGRDGYFYNFSTVATPLNTWGNVMQVRIERFDADLRRDLQWGSSGVKTITLPTPADTEGRDFGFIDVHQRDGGAFVLVAIERWYARREFQNRLLVMQVTPQGELDTSAFAGGYYTPRIDVPGRSFDSPRVHSVVSGKNLHIVITDDSRYDVLRLTDKPGSGVLVVNRPMGQRGIQSIHALPDGRVVVEQYGWVAPLVEEEGRAAIGSFVHLQPPGAGGKMRGAESIPDEIEDRLRVSEMIMRPDGVMLGIGTGFLTRVLPGKLREPRNDDLPNAGESDIAADGAGRVHLLYRDTRRGALTYRHRDETGRWGSVERIDGGAETGVYLGIAADKQNRPVVAYYHGPTSSLRLARRVGRNDWRIVSIDDRGSVGQYVDLAVGDDGRARVAYQWRSAQDLRVAIEQTDGTFKLRTIDDAGDTGYDISMTLDPMTQFMLIAYTNRQGEVRMARELAGGKWDTRVVAPARPRTGVAMGYDPFYEIDTGLRYAPVVAYRNPQERDLVLARFDLDKNRFGTYPISTPGKDDGYGVVFVDPGFTNDRFLHFNRATQRPIGSWYRRDDFDDAILYPRADAIASAGSNLWNGTVFAFRSAGVLSVRDYVLVQ